MFPTRENEHGGDILLSSIAPIRNKSTLRKITETQSQLCQTVHFYLFSINKYLIYICMATMASTSTNIVANVVTGLVGKFLRTLATIRKTTSKHSALPLCTSGHPWVSLIRTLIKRLVVEFGQTQQGVFCFHLLSK